MPSLRSFICLFLLVCLSLGAGCAKKTATPVMVEYYPACHEPLAYLNSRHGGTGKAVAGGAVQGGVISGIAAGIIGAIAGGLRPAGILTSVGVGAALGGTVAGASHHSNQQKEDNQHLAAYLEQIDGDINGLDIVSAAATLSEQCYTKEFKALLTAMRERRMTEDGARKRFKEIAAGTEEADNLLNKPANTAEMEKEFVAAANN